MLAIALPDSLGPYAVLLAIGFLVGWYGTGAKSNWIVAFGIVRDPGGDRPAAAGDRHAQRQGTDRFLTMGVLDDLDLTLKLSREEEQASGSSAAWTRLTQLRLTLGGLDRQRRARAARLRGLRGRGRLGQGRGDQAAGGAARPAPRPRRPVRRADPRREAPPLPLALLAVAARLGRDGRLRPLLVRPGSRRAGGGARDPRAVACAPTTRSTASSAPWPMRE